MEQRTTTDPEEQLERTGDELAERLDTLDDHIDGARKEAQARREEADPGENGEGWDDDDGDDAGGEPDGFDDPEAEEDDEDDD